MDRMKGTLTIRPRPIRVARIILLVLITALVSACSPDGGELIFKVLLVNDLGEAVIVYSCETSDCSTGYLSDPQTAAPGAAAPENQSSDGGSALYLIVAGSPQRRRCFNLEFHTRLDNIRIPMSDATAC
jgi:hypothetical protein